MRLISCHIENFGKLHELDIDFDPGESVIFEENGWGKSTLAAFIRIMFYGFENEGKRDGNVKDVNLYISKIDEMIERKRKLFLCGALEH